MVGFVACDVCIYGDFNFPGSIWTDYDGDLDVVTDVSIAYANVLCVCFSYLNMIQNHFIPNSYSDFLDLVFRNLSATVVCCATESLLNVTERYAANEISFLSVMILV